MYTIKLLDGLLHRITESGQFTTYLFKLSDGSYGRVYTGRSYRNFHNWRDIQVGDLVSGLIWHNEVKKIIDGDSPLHISHAVMA